MSGIIVHEWMRELAARGNPRRSQSQNAAAVTLQQALLMRKPNSLNLIRLLLATAVIVSHSWALGGFGGGWLIGTKTLGTWAVDGFFCISGFLIASSRVRLSPARFL